MDGIWNVLFSSVEMRLGKEKVFQNEIYKHKFWGRGKKCVFMGFAQNFENGLNFGTQIDNFFLNL